MATNIGQCHHQTSLKCPTKGETFFGQRDDEGARQYKSLIWGVSLASIVVYINLYLMQGMLVTLSEHFGVSGSEASLVLSVSSFSLALSLLGFAIISDRIGRHQPMIVSLWLIVLSNLALVFITEFEVLLLVRLFQGLLLAAVPACAMAYFRDVLPTDKLLKAAAFYIAANSIGGIGGRIVGGLMSQYLDWSASMVVMSLVTLALVSSVHILLPKIESSSVYSALTTHAIEGKGWHERGFCYFKNKLRLAYDILMASYKDIEGFRYHLSDPPMRMVYLSGGLAFMMMVNQFSFIQLHLIQAFDWSRFEATLVFFCYLSGTLASYHSARWMIKFGHAMLFRKSLFLMLSGSILTLNDTPFFIFMGFIFTASGFFLLHACCNSWVAMRAKQHRAKASALYLCSYYLGASLGGPYLMMFWKMEGWAGVVTGSMGILILLTWAIAKLDRISQASNEGSRH